MRKTLFTIGLLTAVAATSNAAVLTATNTVRKAAPTQQADSYTRHDSSVSHGGTTLRGYYSNATNVQTPVFVFTLPDLAGLAISTADFSVYGATNLAHDTHNSALDLYGVRVAAETGSNADTEVVSSDEANSAAFAVSGNNGVGIMDDFFPASNTSAVNGTYSTDGAADLALGSWLQSLYDGGASAGDYVYLRLTPDTVPSGVFNRGWNVNSSVAANGSDIPTLTITTIPEPTSMALVALSGLALFFRRRR